jgi:hypothetical protein
MRLSAAPLALVGLFIACPLAVAQGQAPNAKPVTAATPSAAPAPPPPTERRRPTQHADARVCLEFPTELQVIACAEKYRWAKSR